MRSQFLSTFKLNAVWAQIVGVSSPSVAPSLPIVSLARTRKRKKYLSVIPSVLGVTLVFLYPTGWVFIVIGAVIFTLALRDSEGSQLKQEVLQKHKEAEQAWEQLSARWSREAGHEAFTKKYNELEKAKREYQGLVGLRSEKIKQLESQQRNRQLYAYLQRFRIEDAKIEGIGPSRKATLESFGIESAADINANAIRQVPGFGPSYTRKLTDWRSRVERNFAFNPKLGVPQSDIANVDRDMAVMRKRLEQELLAGQSQLTQISNQIKVRRNAIWSELLKCANRLAQAYVDRRAL
jgi:DNA-binding helix-hairpin-helix protein with protein kinase domain